MKAQKLLIVVVVLGLLFNPIYSWACYTATGCEEPETFVATGTKWPASVNNVEYFISTNHNGGNILPTDVLAAAQQWNNASCGSQDTGFPTLDYQGTTSLVAGNRDDDNVIGFAHVDGPDGEGAHADVMTASNNNTVIVECDIRIDYYDDHETHANLQPPTLETGYCLQETTTHELGHWVQLGDVRTSDRCGSPGSHICPAYWKYTMQNCFEKDQHHRESLHDADKYSAWYTYHPNQPSPAPGWIREMPPPADSAETMLQTRLLQNYPDPFNPETWIPYELAEDSVVSIKIYDTMGILVRSFDLGLQRRGSYVESSKALYWNGANDNGETVSSGVYFYTLETDDFSESKRLVILK